MENIPAEETNLLLDRKRRGSGSGVKPPYNSKVGKEGKRHAQKERAEKENSEKRKENTSKRQKLAKRKTITASVDGRRRHGWFFSNKLLSRQIRYS